MSQLDAAIAEIKKCTEGQYGHAVTDSEIDLVVEDLIKEKRILYLKKSLGQFDVGLLMGYLDERKGKENNRLFRPVVCSRNESTTPTPIVETARELGEHKTHKRRRR